ncbi:MAG: PEGA domain-containing protein [Spirochaetaceae bacterium]|jgi:hypothetical protein|nr:PEGA domain-containing protein [Spirochaetaceae bacterium]
MTKKFMIKGISFLMVLILFSGCVSTTIMRVNAIEPTGKPVDNATVLVNGENIGQTPNARTKVSNFVGNDTEITVLKEGYYTAKTEAVKELKEVNMILGILLNIWAFLWISGPKAQQNVILLPETPAEK